MTITHDRERILNEVSRQSCEMTEGACRSTAFRKQISPFFSFEKHKVCLGISDL